jgi:N-acetylglucosaminyldiphosphoundecaprenol N-acetyl-beta-D-mannosaminyltransferase
MNEHLNIFGLQVCRISFKQAIEQVKCLGWERKPSYVCFSNVHMITEAYKDPSFACQVNNATMVLADGSPLAQACFLLHRKKQERIAGMDFMPSLLAAINEETSRLFRVFFYGSTPKVLEALINRVQCNYKNVQIAGAISPPFHSLSEAETKSHIDRINQSGAHIVFVSLGCPKQEKWMASNFQNINAVLLGVGGVFMVTAGLHKRAPKYMQKAGLEWFYRFLQEPKRLFKRYLVTNCLFISLFLKALAKKVFYGR